ncbi:broad specificity phosphatase PhoE [Deinobacterium chartae]|uniref:Broad specificity phosphatase PhoE n=1 Tax=Deinobacterium chartae TaxID=521158 RepID=A0A841HXZ0_9DEIO|nr:histidine phosphatase family protein [Deinobacterium chartae]MBB6097743.1 broad specificity phosphatase PhoE [Deinobacterium chartae]
MTHGTLRETELWLVRHGHTADNARGRYPDGDPGLSPEGYRQARALRALRSFDFERVLSSPAARSLETARHAGFTPAPADTLREADFGVMAGLSWSELEGRHGDLPRRWIEGLLDPRGDQGPPGGESGRSFHARVAHLLALEGRTLAFTHAGPIRALLRLTLDLSAVDLAPGSLTVLRRMGDTWGLSKLNLVPGEL